MATATEVRKLTTAYRSYQVQRAALVATLVAAYYRSKVDPEDPSAVERWLNTMIPRILGRHDEVALAAAKYASTVRHLELPNEPKIEFTPSLGAIEEQVKRSLLVVGPGDYLNKMREIRALDVSPMQEKALIRDAKEVTARKIAASTVRHVQNGGRQTLIEAARNDRVALGYVRVTKDKPCFFCAMLASRGLVFAEDSFAGSDPRFTGDGTAKVHDECQCTMKPVYRREEDPFLQATQKFTDMWTEWGAGGGGSDAVLRFRRGYEHWEKTGEMLDWATVNSREAFVARNSAA